MWNFTFQIRTWNASAFILKLRALWAHYNPCPGIVGPLSRQQCDVTSIVRLLEIWRYGGTERWNSVPIYLEAKWRSEGSTYMTWESILSYFDTVFTKIWFTHSIGILWVAVKRGLHIVVTTGCVLLNIHVRMWIHIESSP